MVVGLLVSGVGLAVVASGNALIIHPAVVFAGLAIFGFGFGLCDVAMNVEGTMIEKKLNKSLMTGFHAVFSLGTFIGALAGWLAVKLHVSVSLHLLFVVFVLIGGTSLLYRLVPAGTGKEEKTLTGKKMLTARERLAVWREPRTLLLGVIILGMSFAEGSANDWLPLIMVDGYGTTATAGSFVYGLFVAAMTIFRAVGGKLLDAFGRVAILRASAVSAVAGLLIVMLSDHYLIASIGVVLWGFGSAFGFPVALSAAGDNPEGVAARVGAVATAGYMAFLVGPPTLGMLGESIGLRQALIFVLIGIVCAGMASGASRPVAEKREPSGERTV